MHRCRKPSAALGNPQMLGKGPLGGWGWGQEHTGEGDGEQTLKDLDTCLKVWAQTF